MEAELEADQRRRAARSRPRGELLHAVQRMRERLLDEQVAPRRAAAASATSTWSAVGLQTSDGARAARQRDLEVALYARRGAGVSRGAVARCGRDDGLAAQRPEVREMAPSRSSPAPATSDGPVARAPARARAAALTSRSVDIRPRSARPRCRRSEPAVSRRSGRASMSRVDFLAERDGDGTRRRSSASRARRSSRSCGCVFPREDERLAVPRAAISRRARAWSSFGWSLKRSARPPRCAGSGG